jgi:WD40 repeat protein
MIGTGCRWIPALAVLALESVSAWAADETPQVKILGRHSSGVFSLAFSSPGHLLVSAGADRSVKFWRLTDAAPDQAALAKRHQWLAELDADRFQTRQQAFLELAALGYRVQPDLEKSLSTSRSAEVRVRVRHLLELLAVPAGAGHEGDVRSVACADNGALVASGSRDNTIRLWQTSSERSVAVLRAHTDGTWTVAFAPDGHSLVSGGGDHLIQFWDLASRTVSATLHGHESTVQRVAFSPDGRTLASAGGFDRTARLWDVPSKTLRATLDKHADAVLCVAFSADGRQLASCGYEGLVHLWRVADGQHLGEIPCCRDVLRGVAFHPRQTILATAGDDRSVRLYRPDTGELLAVWKGHEDVIQALAFAPDGTSLITADRAGTLRQWSLDGVARP